MDRLICRACGSDALVGEIKVGLLCNASMSIHCCDCGSEYSAPMELRIHTKLDSSFRRKDDSKVIDEKNYKVSFKDTDTGEVATLISKEDNGIRLTRFYHDMPIGGVTQ